MPITQYSKIQHRRGTITDFNTMPAPLNTSELGHVIDQGRVFIGNGQLIEGAAQIGNTELITEYTLLNNPTALKYVYTSNTGVAPQTGPSPNSPIVRGLGSILDDYVSVKDFGAKGDGVTDDTSAINRALQQIYTIPVSVNPQAGYRKLFFPAGQYIVSDYLYLPPHANIFGEGPYNTVIKMIGTIGAVFKTADSLFQTGIQMGSNGAVLPTNIEVKDLTCQNTSDNIVIRLERASNVYFENVLFLGAWTGSSSSSSAIYLDSLGAVYTPTNIKATNCSFMYTYYALNLTSNAANANQIYFDGCNFQNHNNVIFSNNVCDDVKVTNSRFNTILSSAIIASPFATNFSSSNNTYNTVGSITDSAIVFQTNGINSATNCSSINDKFENCALLIQDNGRGSLVINSGTITVSALPPFTLVNQPTNLTSPNTGFALDLTQNNSAFIDYTLLRGNDIRVGRLMLASKNAHNVITDVYSESANTGIEFNASLSSNTLTITFTDTTNDGNNSVWTIQPKLFKS